MRFIESQYEIYPCPFCGHDAGLCRVGGYYVIQCKHPACKAEQVVYSSEEEAVRHWNHRVYIKRGDKTRMQIATKDCKTCTNQDETSGENCYECLKGICNHYKPITKETSCEHCVNAKDYSEDGFYCKADEMYCRADVSCEKFKPITDKWVEDLD